MSPRFSHEPSQSLSLGPELGFVEERDRYIAYLDLPGVSASDLKVTLSGSMISVEGLYRDQRVDGKMIQETRFGKFHRFFMVPGGVRETDIEVILENGVLEIVFPRDLAVMRREIPVRTSHVKAPSAPQAVVAEPRH